jgi:fibrillarin-like pre-rRNA processing protein
VRAARPLRPSRTTPRLVERTVGDRVELWTETVGVPPPVYGERWADSDDRRYRAFDPSRSKLAAAIARGWDGPLPRPGERWLYLGAASGTTASHVADLVGPRGRVYALERSLRPFVRLYALSERWPNLLPILADARDGDSFADLVPPVDGIYVDIAQPDQVEIALGAADGFLRGPGAVLLLALKASSMGRELAPAAHAERAEVRLTERFDLAPTVKLDPFHRAHYLLGGTEAGAPTGGPPAPAVRPRPWRRRAR